MEKGLIKGISRITFAVTDTEGPVKYLQEQFGLCDWEFRGAKEFPNANHTFCRDLDVEMQFLEPLNENSGAEKWFAYRGKRMNGICSIEFICTKTLKEMQKIVEDAGYTTSYIGTERLTVNCQKELGIAIILKEDV